jgi:5-formyltetrahydrofolate cyclo-ligase
MLEPSLKPGHIREQVWSELVRQNAAAFPMPPHGHNPNFKGARAAAKKLLKHPQLESAQVVLIGMEAALLPLRGMLLGAGTTIIVPHRTKAGAFWRLENVDKAAARIENFHVYGTATTLDGVQVAVLGSVAVDATGRRLSKGFGFGAKGAPKPVPTLTIVHPCMVLPEILEPDSVVQGFASSQQLVLL